MRAVNGPGKSVNLIERTYRVRGKQVNLQELADVAAVRPDTARSAPAAAPAGPALLSARPEPPPPRAARPLAMKGMAPDAALPQVRALEAAGWVFVPRDDAAGGARVYLKPGGRVVLGTDRLSVRVDAGRSEEEARQLLSRHGLSVRERLKLAPNLFVVSVPPGEDPLDVAARLTASGDVVFAEPELIEVLPGR